MTIGRAKAHVVLGAALLSFVIPVAESLGGAARAADPAPPVQLVAITFDDNFGLIDEKSEGGVPAIVDHLKGLRNPAGRGDPADFDGAPIRVTFFNTALYAAPAEESVEGVTGQPWHHRNKDAGRRAAAAGHEVANHTVRHRNGGRRVLGAAECCRARDWGTLTWRTEIETADAMLSKYGVARQPTHGFRAPYLSVNESLFTALSQIGKRYDSSVPGCFEEAIAHCGWPYRIAAAPGAAKRAAPGAGELARSGLWEVPVASLALPDDDRAQKYGFRPGLKKRLSAKLRAASVDISPAVGKTFPAIDYDLLVSAGASGSELGAILEYNLDRRRAGNRAPMVIVAHSHLYAYSSPETNADTPTPEIRRERWLGLTRFIAKALAKPDVRLVAAEDIVDWMERREALSRD